MAAVLLAGCSDELDRGGAYNLEEGITATIPTYPFDDGTRVNISDDLQTFTWSDNDKLGIYYSDYTVNAFVGFQIKQGGSSTGSFENKVFALNPSTTYYAFYPFNANAIVDEAPVDFTGQVQNGNGSASHLGAYNFMYGTLATDGDGKGSVSFKNLGSVMQLRLTVFKGATYTGIDITSNGTEFITKGTASMIDGSITATETSSSIHLVFQNGITLNVGDVLTANILVAPVDMSGSNLTITLIDTEEKTYEVTTAGKNMLQGKAYLYAETLPYKDVDEIPYVTFTADAEQTFKFAAYVATPPDDSGILADFELDTLIAHLEYSINNQDWVAMSGPSSIIFGGMNGNLRIRGKNPNGTSRGTFLYSELDLSPYSKISFGNETAVACSGDIRTLVDFEDYASVSTDNVQFVRLFSGCSQLTSTPELPATVLAENCYRSMFSGCTALTQTPELPATELAEQCYRSMFDGCTALTQAPELPATNLANYCYVYMLRGCTALTQAPSILPATNLTLGCYASMFDGCTALTQAPELPATNLAHGCYEAMFYGCTALTQAPELPATTLDTYCYYYMFWKCYNLNYIKIMATDISAEGCLNSCVYPVISTGTFVKNSAATWEYPTVVPSDWTTIYYNSVTGKYYLDKECTQECDDHGNPL